MNVDLIAVTHNTDIPKKDGGSYKGTLITFSMGGKVMTKGIHANGLKFNPALKKDLETITIPGPATFVLVEKDGFKNLSRVVSQDSPVASTAQTTATTAQTSKTWEKKTGGYDVQGAIKGNAVTNGVNIAISQGDTSLANIVKQANIVLEAHKALETVGTAEVVETPTVDKVEKKVATKKTVIKEEVLDDDDLGF